MELMLEPATAYCGKTESLTATPPAAAAQRISGSQAVPGQRDIAWAWLGSPTVRYPHAALGLRTHAGSLHVLSVIQGKLREVVY